MDNVWFPISSCTISKHHKIITLKMKIHLQMLGLTLLHFLTLMGCVFESPYTLSQRFPCHVLTLLMNPKLMLQQRPREWKFKSHFVHVIIVIYIGKYNHVDVAKKLDDALWVQQTIDNWQFFDLFWCYWFMWWHGYLFKIKLVIYIIKYKKIMTNLTFFCTCRMK